MAKDYYDIAARRGLFYNGKHLPYDRKLSNYARQLRKDATPEERKLWVFLKGLDVHVYRQRPIDHYIVDFYIHDASLVIEVDGCQHYMEEKNHDDERTQVLESYELTMIRFANKAVLENYEGVCENIMHAIRKARKI